MTFIALITGITGQDGSYLAELCLKKTILCTALYVVTVVFTLKESTIFFKSKTDLRRYDRPDQFTKCIQYDYY